MPDEIAWSDEAKITLDKIPEFVRPMAKEMIENYARDQGATEITAELMKQARAKFGM